MRVLYFYQLGQFYPIKSGADYVVAGHLQFFQDRGDEVHCLLPRAFGRGIEDESQITTRFPCVKSVRLLDIWVNRAGLSDVLHALNRAAVSQEFRKIAEEPFDLFFTNYVSSAPFAVQLPNRVWKVVETLDLITRQFRGIMENNRTITAQTCVREAEVRFVTKHVELDFYRVFNRAIMISPEETEYIRNLGYPEAQYIPPVFPVRERTGQSKPDSQFDLLFVGSGNSLNTYGMNWFYRHVYLPYLRPKRVTLALAGVICQQMSFQDECVTKLGCVDDLDSVYDLAKLVVVPIFHGTGVAIKTLEALAAGCAVVSTPQGVRGIDRESKAFECIDMAADPQQTAEIILGLLNNPMRREELGIRASALMRKRYSKDAYNRAMNEVISPH